MDEQDEDDVVVEEIPVFLSKALMDNLYLLQYPNKLNSNNSGPMKVVNSRIKPINEELKIEVELNTESEHFDKFKAEQFAIASDGKTHGKNERPSYQNGLMDRQTFISTKPIENVNKYAIGIIQDNEVHLSPLKNIFQLRPSFSHFDKQDKRNKAEQKAAEDVDGGGGTEEEIKQVTVKFSRADAEKLNKAREKTYDYMMQKSKEEPWCETTWYDKSSKESELERQKLFANRNELSEHTFSLNSKQYIEKLIPPEKSDESLETILPSKVISSVKLKTMPLKEQLQTLLKDTKMMRFVEIMSILEKYDKTITAEKVLRTLPLVGILIRGNWVPQSEILYPPETVSNWNGVSAELMIRGRDYILYKFSKQEFLHRRKVIITTQLPHDEVCEILQSVARLNAEKKWELILPPDTGFEARYPELVQRQEMIWRTRENIFNEMEYEKSPKRVRKRSVKSESKS